MAQIVPPLAAVLADFPNFRDPRGVRHPLCAVLLLSCVAMLCGARGESAIAAWAENYGEAWRTPLGFTRPDGPSQSTVQRVFKGLDCALLETRLGQWAAQVVAHCPNPPHAPLPLEAMAIDGKTLRGSAKCGAEDAQLLSAFSQRLGVVLGQVAVPDKTNEITAIDGCPLGSMLTRLVLTGWVVTTDALFTQTDIAQAIYDAGGNYLMAVKGNQPTLHDTLTLLFADPEAPYVQAEERRMHGGRIERRVLRASSELMGCTDWPGLAQAVCVERRVTRKATGETRTDVAYAITSLAPTVATPAQLLVLWREHWGIENKLHWIRDVTFDEDRSTVRAGNIPQVMAALRSTAISVARLHEATNIAAACRRYAAQPALALAAVGLTLDFE